MLNPKRALPLLALAAALVAPPTAGAAADAPATLSQTEDGRAMPNYSFKMSSPRPGRLVVRGRIQPAEAALDASVGIYRSTRTAGTYVQLAPGKTTRANGRFKFVIKDEKPGRHRYFLQIVPHEQREWEALQVEKAVKIKGKSRGKRKGKRRSGARRRAEGRRADAG